MTCRSPLLPANSGTKTAARLCNGYLSFGALYLARRLNARKLPENTVTLSMGGSYLVCLSLGTDLAGRIGSASSGWRDSAGPRSGAATDARSSSAFESSSSRELELLELLGAMMARDDGCDVEAKDANQLRASTAWISTVIQLVTSANLNETPLAVGSCHKHQAHIACRAQRPGHRDISTTLSALYRSIHCIKNRTILKRCKGKNDITRRKVDVDFADRRHRR
jgi:hypothetical protein